MIFEIVLIIFLIICSGFFSGSETALFSLSRIKLRRLQSAPEQRSRLVASLLERPRHLLITILIGNMIVNILASSVSASLFRKLAQHNAEILSVLVMTTLILIFGEITPKTFALRHSEPVSRFTAPIIKLISTIISPFRKTLWVLTNAIITLLYPRAAAEKGITEAELITATKLGLKDGVLDQQERDMIHGVLEIENKQVREMMKPRMEIFALPVRTALETVCRSIQHTEYTRIPIYEGEIDKIIGILNAKDLLYIESEKLEKIDLKSILRQAYFVPETMPIEKLFQEFRCRKTHLALVVDEYGSLSGIITLEDLLEIIVGDIDSKRFETKRYHILGPGTIRISSRLPIDEFNEIFGCDLSDEFAVTVGGLVIHRMGKIPEPGEIFEYGGLRFQITSALKNRVDELIVTRPGGDKTWSDQARRKK